LNLLDSPSTTIITKYGTISMTMHYVFVYSVPKTLFYTTKYKDFLVDTNVGLICGWGKETDLNHL